MNVGSSKQNSRPWTWGYIIQTSDTRDENKYSMSCKPRSFRVFRKPSCLKYQSRGAEHNNYTVVNCKTHHHQRLLKYATKVIKCQNYVGGLIHNMNKKCPCFFLYCILKMTSWCWYMPVSCCVPLPDSDTYMLICTVYSYHLLYIWPVVYHYHFLTHPCDV